MLVSVCVENVSYAICVCDVRFPMQGEKRKMVHACCESIVLLSAFHVYPENEKIKERESVCCMSRVYAMC